MRCTSDNRICYRSDEATVDKGAPDAILDNTTGARRQKFVATPPAQTFTPTPAPTTVLTPTPSASMPTNAEIALLNQ